MNSHRGEISIGEGRWIPYFELEGRYESAVNVDCLLRPTDDVWTALETQCVAGCCGIKAFEFWPDQIRTASARLDIPEAVQKLQTLRCAIAELPAEVVISNRLNSYMDKRQLTMLVEHLLASFQCQREA